MIAVDTSALVAVILQEPGAGSCVNVLESEPELLISAATLAEAMIVAARRDFSNPMARLLERLPTRVVPTTDETARRIGLIYRAWGKGFHPAALNFGDCFAYDVAKQHRCPLLYVGNDFARTDVAGALP